MSGLGIAIVVIVLIGGAAIFFGTGGTKGR
jgi:hypothetical protein